VTCRKSHRFGVSLFLLLAAGIHPTFAAAGPGIGILDAVRSTVALHPLIKAAEEDFNAGVARRIQASGAFDMHYGWSGLESRAYTPLTDYERLIALGAGIDTSSQAQNVTDFTAQSSTLLRNGISFGPVLELSRLADNLENIGAVSRGRIDFQTDIPLRRGRGREAVTAPERAAEEAANAAALQKNETIASLVYSTALAYWNYVAALRSLEIHRESERRGADFLSSVRTLIAADRMPGIEAHQAIANLEAQTTARIGAEQRVIEARQSLGYAMGLGAMEAQAIPPPSENFPAAREGSPALTDPAAFPTWFSQALTLRAGYLATEKADRSADALRTAARNQLLPEMDLILRSGYSGLTTGARPDQYLYSLADRVQGVDFSAELRYSFSRGNNLAKGQFAEAEANFRKAEYIRTDAANRIASNLVSALAAVETSAAALSRARNSVTEYESALAGAREKLRLAAGSLIDLLTIEQRLTGSQLDLVNAQLQYALAIVQLRYTSGTMLGPDPLHPALESRVFFEPPAPPTANPAGGPHK
jgi:outer membrane protein TolC